MVTRRFILGVLPLAMAVPPGLAAAQDPDIGIAVALTGTGAVRRDGRDWALATGMAIADGDRVRTGAESFAELLLYSETRINLGPQADFAIDRFVADVGGTLTVGAGAMVFDRPDDLPPLDLTLQVGFAQIGVRGTRFFVGPSQGEVAVFVERGSVGVGNGADGRPVTLRAGEGIALPAPGGTPGPVTRWGQARIAAAFAAAGTQAAG